MKRVVFYFKTFSLMPLVNLVLLASLIARVYFIEGHFPSYDNPDPKEMGIHYSLYFLSEIIVVFSLFLWPIFLLLGYRKIANKALFIFLYCLGLLLTYFLFKTETLGLGEWIMD